MTQLIIGLANPGKTYESTRHNAGAWFIQKLISQAGAKLSLETKLKTQIAQISTGQHTFKIAIPTTYMNESGLAVAAILNFYKIPPEQLLVAHDEIDFSPGTTRLKFGGGEGGHNGLRSIVQHIGTKNFHRLRIGVGHPGNSHDVVNYVLNTPSKSEKIVIDESLEDALQVVPDILAGDFEKAMMKLHSE
jgi:PTH1 family peptidyl-tRNA hydrolase